MSAQPNADISQIVAVSYDAVLNKKRGPSNQWLDGTIMYYLNKMGMIDKRSFGPTLEYTIDHRRNPGAKFLATDLEPVSRAKTEVISAARFSPALMTVPVVWSKNDELKNPSENQKQVFSANLWSNAFDSADDVVEEAFFSASTNGFLGFPTLIPTSGQGSVGGIDASDEVMWRNPTDSYLADGSDMEAVLDELFLSAQKGSASRAKVKLLVSGAEALALFRSVNAPYQRFTGTSLDAGFDTSAYNKATFIHSQYGGTTVYGLSESIKLAVSKEMYRKKGETMEQDDAEGYIFKITSGLQLCTDAKSRNFVATEA